MIIAVDFDNTLAITYYPEIICPKTYIIQRLKNMKKRNKALTLILWTCRKGKYLDDAVKWCREQGLEFDYINENSPDMILQYGDSRKVYADLYIDDHSLNPIDWEGCE